MLAQRVERDVAHDDHLVTMGVKGLLEEGGEILIEARTAAVDRKSVV